MSRPHQSVAGAAAVPRRPAAQPAPGLAAAAIAVLLLITGYGEPVAAEAASAPLEGADPAHFPVPTSLHAATDFWRRVYTEVDTTQGFVHDNRHLDVVYETVELGDRLSYRKRSRIAQRRITHYRRVLEKLASGKRKGLSDEQARVLALWPEGVTNGTLAQAAQRLRFQLGQSDRFRDGLERAGRYLPHIERELARAGLPADLALLPHVESSFTPGARSHAAAVGLWQFTRSTGRRFMRIDHVVDERLDPFRASTAAVQLLGQNHEDLGVWPLALTAYNHGVAGMGRAVRQLGTSDIGEIVQHYHGRTFGFASRNFYASFIAAVHVHRYAEQYFPGLTPEPARDEAFVEIPDFIPAATVAATLGVDPAALEKLNPALRWPVWHGEKHIPRGYHLRLPKDLDPAMAAIALDDVPRTQRFAQQTPDIQHRVAKGETLSAIASRYGVSARAVADLNGLRSAHFIRIGQTLKLPARPGSNTSAAPTAVIAAASAAPPVTASISAPVPDAAASAPSGTGGTYRVRRGDTLSVIARRLGVRMNDLVAANQLNNVHRLKIGQVLTVPGEGETYAPYVPELYTVQRGDSVWEVAARFNLESAQIMALNRLSDGQHIFIGQKLRLLPTDTDGSTAGE